MHTVYYVTVITAKHSCLSYIGCLSRKEWEELGNWTVQMGSDDLGIAPSGVAELFEMGQRTRQRFPRLFNSMTHQSQVEIRCTGFERAKANSANFLHGLFGLKGMRWIFNQKAVFLVFSIILELFSLEVFRLFIFVPFLYSGSTADSTSPHVITMNNKEDKLLLFLDLCKKYIRARLDKVNLMFPITPCSKRNYTLCFPVSTQNVAGAAPPAVLRDSQSEFLNNQATVGEEIPNGSKVLRESLLGSCVRKFTESSMLLADKVHTLKLWFRTLEPLGFFFTNSVLFDVELQRGIPHTF